MNTPRHPLARFASATELLELPYFELLAILTDEALHPGGGAATQLLLDVCRLNQSDRVLEIGCGPGWTTRALSKVGVSVSVIEPCALMIEAMRYNCHCDGLKPPPVRHGNIEGFADTAPFGHLFDVILLECVVGFVNDKRKLQGALLNNLTQTGRIGVLDVHYLTLPSTDLQERLTQVTGHHIEPMTSTDWEGLFPSLVLKKFETFNLASNPQESSEELVEKSAIKRWFPSADNATIHELVSRVKFAADTFAENKSHMAGHIAVFEPRYQLR